MGVLMPKTRGSHTVGNSGNGSRTHSNVGGTVGFTDGDLHNGGAGVGGSGAAGENIPEDEPLDESEVVDRLENRLSQVRIVTVTEPSNSRRRNEEIHITFDPGSPGVAQIQSESGAEYQVDYINGTCTCPHHRYRQETCRHIEATNRAIGEIVGERELLGTEVGQSLGNAEIGSTLNEQQVLDAQDEEARRALSGIQDDDNFFYSDNIEEFRSRLQGIGEGDLPYEYDNVLNGSQVTFGIELEFVGGDPDAIARELYQKGICGYSERVGYHARTIPGKWKLERDGSVSSGNEGGELVSPILQDTPETWKNIEQICEVAKRHGAVINSQCGAHVHIGMEPLDTARQRWKRFFKGISSYEECLYRFAGGDLGRIRSGHRHYATPFSQRATSTGNSRFTLNDIQDVNNLASRASENNRYYGINLTNIYESGKPNTVEFRYFNGSLNEKTIQANVKLANGVVIASEKARTGNSESEDSSVSESMKRRGNLLKSESPSYSTREESAIMKFVDIMFSRKKDKDYILGIFSKNSWR
jgi:hypothetical protein